MYLRMYVCMYVRKSPKRLIKHQNILKVIFLYGYGSLLFLFYRHVSISLNSLRNVVSNTTDLIALCVAEN